MVNSSMGRSIRRPAKQYALRYGTAFASVAAALVLELVFVHFNLPHPFTAFALSAIAITFWYGGTKPGILAVLLSLFVRGYFFEPGTVILSRVIYDLAFVIFGVLMSWLTQTRNQLEVMVAERTAKLTAANELLQIEVAERKEAEERLGKAFEEIKQLKDQLHDENIALREQIDQAFMFEEIVGSSPALRVVLSSIVKVAPTESTVLITGETGTGKELIARAIHKRSQRFGQAFISVNCASIPSSLIASELFGHEKGAFTGALQQRQGRFEQAHSGTIFLDEIGELPAETQIALLRVLQERKFERVGGNRVLSTDVRVITATNRDLPAAIVSGAFRPDLFYRLNVFPIEVPPLRQRREDIPMLVEYFVKRYAEKVGKQISRIDKNTLELCQSYYWPGNIRELQNVIERSVILCEGDTFWVDEAWLTSPGNSPEVSSVPLTEALQIQEKEIIEAALADSKGKVAGPDGAAAKLGIPRSTLDWKIKQLNIKRHKFKQKS